MEPVTDPKTEEGLLDVDMTFKKHKTNKVVPELDLKIKLPKTKTFKLNNGRDYKSDADTPAKSS